jgi:hypothetical protein
MGSYLERFQIILVENIVDGTTEREYIARSVSGE